MTENEIQKGLEHEARKITERIPEMARRTEAMELTAAQLRAFMEKNSLSQAQIARKVGVSAAVINQFLSNKYKGDVKTIVNKVVNLINSTERQQSRPKQQPFVQTTVAKQIAALITNTESFSDDEGKIGLIVGDGGHGKSHCLRAYAEANRNTIYIELDDAMTTTQLFADIAESLHIDSSGRLSSITRRIIENLHNRNMIVMLDEASSLTVKQLNQLRQIIAVKSRCPLILAGNQGLIRTVMQPTTHGHESLDQFTSRLMAILNLDEMATRKDGGLYTAKDIQQLYEYGGVRLTTDGVKALRKICKTRRSGRLRTCSHIISALHTARAAGRQIDAQKIIQTIVQLDLPVRVRLPFTVAEAVEPDDEAAAAAG